MVEIVGEFQGEGASLIWHDGELIGTDWAVRMFGSYVAIHEGMPIPADMTGTINVTRQHIRHASSVAYLAHEWFDEGVEISGDLPEAGSAPPGAII